MRILHGSGCSPTHHKVGILGKRSTWLWLGGISDEPNNVTIDSDRLSKLNEIVSSFENELIGTDEFLTTCLQTVPELKLGTNVLTVN